MVAFHGEGYDGKRYGVGNESRAHKGQEVVANEDSEKGDDGDNVMKWEEGTGRRSNGFVRRHVMMERTVTAGNGKGQQAGRVAVVRDDGQQWSVGGDAVVGNSG